MFHRLHNHGAVFHAAAWFLGGASLYAAGLPGEELPVYTFHRDGIPARYSLAVNEIVDVSADGGQTVRKIGKAEPFALIDSTRIPAAGAVAKNLVFYPEGREGIEAERVLLRGRLLVKLRPGASAQTLAQRLGAASVLPVPGSPDHAVLVFNSPAAVLENLEAAGQAPEVESAEPLLARKAAPNFIPNDPLFGGDGGTSYQWHLRNIGHIGGLAGIDANITTAWDDHKGSSVTIAIVDDGLEIGHPDLSANIFTVPGQQVHFNWNSGSQNDPTPPNDFDTHGTAVAGVSAARGNNGIGVSGAAPEAKLIGLRLIAGFIDDFDIAQAFLWRLNDVDVSNNSWGPAPQGPTTLRYVSTIERNAIVQGVTAGRDGKGIVYVFAAGNSALSNDNSNYGAYPALSETIAVGAIADNGQRSFYSEQGANLLISAPSNGGAQGITTTGFRGVMYDSDGDNVPDAYPNPDYINDFGGTSSAAPLVSGVAALMLDANPDLGWRDVQDILIRTARKVDATNADWIENAAGFHFNHEYGAGMVDASAAVAEAKNPERTNLGARVKLTKLVVPVADVPDNNGNSAVAVLDFSDQPNIRVEHVEVVASVVHERRADVDVVLISPSGTQSRLAEYHTTSDEQSISDYPFLSVRNWGEGSQGNWLVRVTDRRTGVAGVLNAIQLNVYGSVDPETPVPPVSPVLLSNKLIRGIQGRELVYRIEAVGATGVTIAGTLPPGLVFHPATNQIIGIPTNPGLISTAITLVGPQNSTTTELNFLIEPVQQALGQALEQDGRPFTGGGDGSWDFGFFTDDEPRTGPDDDYAVSPVLVNGQYSEFGTTVQTGAGPGLGSGMVALFDWRVSSRPVDDRLWFSLNQTTPNWTAFIDGQPAWGTVGVRLATGTNTLRWKYQKAGSLASIGADRGFVDFMRLRDWDEFMSDLRESAGSGLDFSPTTSTLWLPVNDATATGGRSLTTSAVGNGQTVGLETQVKGPGILKYKWRTLGSNSDTLSLKRNGALRSSIPGNSTAWADNELPVPVGDWLFTWEYRRSVNQSSGQDFAFLDDIVYERHFLYDSWASDFFSEAEIQAGKAAPGEDADGDGLSNFVEYAWGTDPRSANGPSSRLPAISVNPEGGLTLRFTVDFNLLDVSFTVQSTTDLESWEDLLTVSTPAPIRANVPDGVAVPPSAPASVLNVEADDNLRTYELQIDEPFEDPSRFYRIEVKQVAPPP